MLLASVSILLGACDASAPAGGDPDENAVKSAIESALKKSDRIVDIEVFLKANGFEYSILAESGEIVSIKRNVRKMNVVSKSMSAKFTFHDGKITGFSTEVTRTGP